MIGHLRGPVIERRAAGDNAVELVVDVNGVGYRVLVSPRLGAAVAPSDGEVTLAVHTHVRESAITLYGFTSTAEREAFELLLGAHGVGPALALAVISVHEPDHLAVIVADGDVDALTLVPGVGKKTAARLILDLKARFEQVGLGGSYASLTGSGNGSASALSEVSEALAQLGYANDEIRAVLRELPRDGSPEELLRLALRDLAPRR
jgi:Holliday junction DNA helicase RuvA